MYIAITTTIPKVEATIATVNAADSRNRRCSWVGFTVGCLITRSPMNTLANTHITTAD